MKAFPNGLVYGREIDNGMDLRDYFAAKALQALMADFREDLDWNAHEEAKIAYEIADAMMKVREQ